MIKDLWLINSIFKQYEEPTVMFAPRFYFTIIFLYFVYNQLFCYLRYLSFRLAKLKNSAKIQRFL